MADWKKEEVFNFLESYTCWREELKLANEEFN